jgi:pimeloyl-ACP methyl ester carboxylesterase
MSINEKNTIKRLAELGIAAQIFGNGLKWVICLHGWLDNSNSFIPMVKQRNQDYRWLLIDLPGHGQSQWRSKDAHYYFIDYVYDLLVLLDEINIDKCHLVGHSLGALVCGLFSSLYPKRVISLSMIEGIGLVYADESEIIQQVKQAFKQRQQTGLKETKYYPNYDLLVKARLAVSDFGEKEAKLLMMRNAKEINGRICLTTDPRLKNQSAFRFSLAQSQHFFRDIHIPSLLILGNNGYKFVKESLELFRSGFNNLKIEIIQGGHHCHMQSPSDCIKQIETHINTIDET